MRKESVFLQRAANADSGTFWDTRNAMHRAFEADWSHARLSRLISDSQEAERVREILQQAFFLLREIFRFFAACGSQSPHVLDMTQYHEFCRDYDIVHPKYFSAADADKVFYDANSFDANGGEGKGGGGDDLGGPLSVDSGALERFQFLGK